MIIYWETLEQNAGDSSVLPQYMATDYFGGPGRIKSEDAYPLSPPYGAIRFQPATNQFLGFKKDSGWSALGGAGEDFGESVDIADHSVSGIEIALVAGEELDFGEACYLKADGKMWRADADAIATASAIGICAVSVISAEATGNFLLHGIVRDDTWDLTIGGLIYLATTLGNVTQTPPSGEDDVVQVLGIAVTADKIYFNPSLVQIEHTA